MRLAIYRIVQEALHNALRHAAADEAVVRFEVIDDMLRVTISDNGAGFDPHHAARPRRWDCSARARRGHRAAFAVMSRPGDGTTVVVERLIDAELTTVPGLEPDGDLPELEASVPKRIPA